MRLLQYLQNTGLGRYKEVARFCCRWTSLNLLIISTQFAVSRTFPVFFKGFSEQRKDVRLSTYKECFMPKYNQIPF